jgi:hypothetical protein
LDFSLSEEESPSSAICNQMYFIKKLQSLHTEEFFYSQLYWMAVLVMNETHKSEKIISDLLSFCMQLLNLEGTELAVEPYLI